MFLLSNYRQILYGIARQILYPITGQIPVLPGKYCVVLPGKYCTVLPGKYCTVLPGKYWQCTILLQILNNTIFPTVYATLIKLSNHGHSISKTTHLLSTYLQQSENAQKYARGQNCNTLLHPAFESISCHIRASEAKVWCGLYSSSMDFQDFSANIGL